MNIGVQQHEASVFGIGGSWQRDQGNGAEAGAGGDGRHPEVKGDRKMLDPPIRLGRLGIELPDYSPSSASFTRNPTPSTSAGPGDDADRSQSSDSQSLAVHHSASPTRIQGLNEKGSSRRTGSSKGKGKMKAESEHTETSNSRNGKKSGSESMSRWSTSDRYFREIVDDLTIQNQQLKSRLRQFETPIPVELESNKLFEIKFFDGLSPARREELETFLQSYVQQIASPTSSQSVPVNEQNTDSTSSLGNTIRSLRSSEKEVLRKSVAAEGKELSTTDSRADSGSGSASGSGEDKSSGSSGDKSRTKPSGTSSNKRSRGDTLAKEKEMLAAPSYSGVEPQSVSGTGSGMRISDPRLGKVLEKDRPSSPSQTPSGPTLSSTTRFSSTSKPLSPSQTADEETLANHVVALIEHLFDESLPLVSPSHDPLDLSPPSTLRAEPEPLPLTSSTNTHYLRQLLKGGGEWIYLNLVCTMAGVHRLNVSIKFVRAALRRSSKLELSEEGNKIRWRGPKEKVIDGFETSYAPMGSDAHGKAMEYLDAESEMGARGSSISVTNSNSQSRSTNSYSKLGGGPKLRRRISRGGTTSEVTANTSEYVAPEFERRFPTVKSLEGENSSRGSGPSISRTLPSAPLLPYVAHFTSSLRRSACETSSAASEVDQSERPSKKRKRNPISSKKGKAVGGLTFFASEAFCSDFSGDPTVRQKLALEKKVEDERPTSPEGGTSPVSVEALMALSEEEEEKLESEVDIPSSSEEPLIINYGVDLPQEMMDLDDWSDAYPLKSLSLSGMGQAIPDDNFSILVRTSYPLFSTSIVAPSTSPSPCTHRPITFPLTTVGNRLPPHPHRIRHSNTHTKTVHHIPTRHIRLPRLKLMRDDDSDASDSPSGGGVTTNSSSKSLPFGAGDWVAPTRSGSDFSGMASGPAESSRMEEEGSSGDADGEPEVVEWEDDDEESPILVE